MRNFVSLFSIALFLLVLWRCNTLFDSGEQQAMQKDSGSELQERKTQLLRELQSCSADIAQRMKGLDERISNAGNGTTRTLKDMRTRLRREKSSVDKAIKQLRDAAGESLADASRKSSTILTEAKIEVQRIEERVEDLTEQITQNE